VPFKPVSAQNHTALQYHILGCILGRGKPTALKLENFHQCTHAESDSRLLFQKWLKSVQDKWPKGHNAN